MKIKKNGKVINLTESDLRIIVKRVLTEDFAGTITNLPEIKNMVKAWDPNKGLGKTEYLYPKDYNKTGQKLSIIFYDKSDRVEDFGYPYLIQLREKNDSIPLWTKVYNSIKSNGGKDTNLKGDDRYGKVKVIGVKDKNTVMKIVKNITI